MLTSVTNPKPHIALNGRRPISRPLGMFLLLIMLFPSVAPLAAEMQPDAARWWMQQVEVEIPRVKSRRLRSEILGRLAVLHGRLGEEERGVSFMEQVETEMATFTDRDWLPMALALQWTEWDEALVMQPARKQIAELVKKGDLDAARQFVRTAESHLEFRGPFVEVPEKAKVPLTKALAAAGDIDGAWLLVRELPEKLHREVAFMLLTLEGQQAEATVEALRRRVENHFPDWEINVLYQPGRRLAQEGHGDIALEIARAIGSDRALSNISRDLARQKALAGDIDGAKELFDQISDPGDITNVLLTISNQASRAGDVNTVRWAMEQGDEAWQNQWGWRNLPASMVYANELEQAKHTLREEIPEDEQIRIRVYVRYFRALVQSGRLEEAEAALNGFDETRRVMELVPIAEAYLRDGHSDEAQAMMARFLGHVDDLKQDPDVRPRNFRRLLGQVLSLALQVDDMETVNRLTKEDAYFSATHMPSVWRGIELGDLTLDQLAERLEKMEHPEARALFALAIAERFFWNRET